MLTPLDPDAAGFIGEAMGQRPDLAALQLSRDAAHTFAEAERKLRYPTVTALAAGGVVPLHDRTLHDNYAAAGVNISVPFLNGGLYSARYAEADLRAQAADKDVQDLIVQISRDVRIAWLQANTAFQKLAVTERLLAQANEALRLAQARYDAGLGSIVGVDPGAVDPDLGRDRGRCRQVRLSEPPFVARLHHGGYYDEVLYEIPGARGRRNSSAFVQPVQPEVVNTAATATVVSRW